MHIADLDKGMMGANGIVGGGPPLICGAALAAKVQGTDNVAIAFVGDGGSNQGTTLESLNLAQVWNLPAVFVAENNGYAEATSRNFAVGADSIAGRAAAFGMPAMTVDGHDFFAVFEAVGEAIARARRGEGPAFIECQVNRYYGHFEGDAQTYRAPDEVQNIRDTRDCITGFVSTVVGGGMVEQTALDAIDKEVAELIESAVVAAKSDPKPTAEDLITDVYVTY